MIARNQNIEFAATDLNAQRKWRYVVNNNFGDVRIVAYNGCLDGGTTSNYTKEYTLLTRNKGKNIEKNYKIIVLVKKIQWKLLGKLSQLKKLFTFLVTFDNMSIDTD